MSIEEIKQLPEWQLHWVNRFCPPASVLLSDEPKVKQHLEICHECPKRIQDLETTLALTETDKILQSISVQSSPKTKTAGQIWQINDQLGGWGKHMLFYNPPLVAITEEIEPGFFRVAQISNSEYFRRDGDIQFNEPFDGFIESWNSYPICGDKLTLFIGLIDLTLIQLTKQRIDQRINGEQRPSPEEKEKIIDIFRYSEVVHSVHFAMAIYDHL